MAYRYGRMDYESQAVVITKRCTQDSKSHEGHWAPSSVDIKLIEHTKKKKKKSTHNFGSEKVNIISTNMTI
jgi:hypothetical protein